MHGGTELTSQHAVHGPRGRVNGSKKRIPDLRETVDGSQVKGESRICVCVGDSAHGWAAGPGLWSRMGNGVSTQIQLNRGFAMLHRTCF